MFKWQEMAKQKTVIKTLEQKQQEYRRIMDVIMSALRDDVLEDHHMQQLRDFKL